MQGPLDNKCITCTYYKSMNQPKYGCCRGNASAYKEVTGESFIRGAPEGLSFVVSKLGSCSFYNSIKRNFEV